MSKKSHPGDGQHGKGTKGMKTEFDDVFAPQGSHPASAKKSEQEAPKPEEKDEEQ